MLPYFFGFLLCNTDSVNIGLARLASFLFQPLTELCCFRWPLRFCSPFPLRLHAASPVHEKHDSPILKLHRLHVFYKLYLFPSSSPLSLKVIGSVPFLGFRWGETRYRQPLP